MTEAKTYERSLYEATLDVRYGVRFNELNQRFYQRLDLSFGFVGLFGGSFAFVGVITEHPVIAATAAALVAACAVLERLIRPVERALDHAAFRRRYADLDARTSGLDLSELDAELRRLQGEGPSGISGLSVPAHNLNLMSNGRGDVLIPQSAWQRFVAFLA